VKPRGDLRYRLDIDGLRAIAVLLVVGFHAFPGLLPGGYIGVDIFFVISGYLITGLILHELETKQFSFTAFYARRIKRIFPALIVVLGGSFLAGWVLLLPAELKSLGLNIFGGAAFTSNFVQLNQTGYFDLSAVQKPLLHLWSLGVEEQFYIVWPILMLLAFSRRVSISVLAATVLVISFAWNASEAGTPRDFYLPFTRAWELMLGGFIAALVSQSEKYRLGPVPKMWSAFASVPVSHPNFWSTIGVALIAFAAAALDEHSTFPGSWAVLPTLGTALVLSAEESWFNRKILSTTAMVSIGLISYPLYLWHWPLLSYARMFDPNPPDRLRAAVIVAAIGLAWITYRWIERPIRQRAYPGMKVAGLCIVMAAVGVVGLVTYHAGGFESRVPAAIRDLTNVKVDERTAWRMHTCLLETLEDKSQFAAECVERDRRPLLFLWGDSHAGALYPGLKRLQSSVSFGMAQYATSGCPPVLEFAVEDRPNCLSNNGFIFSSVLPNVRPDIVLLYSRWGYGNQDDLVVKLRDLISKLHLLRIPRIIVMGKPPEWEWPGGLPKATYDFYNDDPLHRLIPVRSSFRVQDDWYRYDRVFQKAVEKMNGVEYISTWNALCDGIQCLTRLSDTAEGLMAIDYAHLTVAGSVYLARVIAPCLFPDSHLNPPSPAPPHPTLICPQLALSPLQ